MKRLTERVDGKVRRTAWHDIGACMDRLAGYEDTGLLPAEVMALKMADSPTMMIDFLHRDYGTIERKQIDGESFCVRDGVCRFTSDGVRYEVEIGKVFQVYMV